MPYIIWNTEISGLPKIECEIEMPKLKSIKVIISSNAAAPKMAFVTGPLALYSCITANVADGSVGVPNDANIKLNARLVAIPKSESGNTEMLNKKNAVNRSINAPNDSKKAKVKYFFPVFFKSDNEKLLPISKVINAKQKFVIKPDTAKKLVGIILNNSGFNNMPANK